MNTAPASSRPVAAIVLRSAAWPRSLGSLKSRSRFARLSAFTGLIRFGIVGMSGMAVNLVVLGALLRLTSHVSATTAQALAETVATQVAILWNFALTETLVFGRTRASGGRLGRLAGFWSVSMAALAVQLPLSHLLDAALGIGYVVATSAALLILVGARFTLCRAILYRGASLPTTGGLR